VTLSSFFNFFPLPQPLIHFFLFFYVSSLISFSSVNCRTMDLRRCREALGWSAEASGCVEAIPSGERSGRPGAAGSDAAIPSGGLRGSASAGYRMEWHV
jgi:hypothetical protein